MFFYFLSVYSIVVGVIVITTQFDFCECLQISKFPTAIHNQAKNFISPINVIEIKMLMECIV